MGSVGTKVLAAKILDLPAGTVIDLDGEAYICRQPDGTTIRFSLETGPDGPVVVKTVFPADAPISIEVGKID